MAGDDWRDRVTIALAAVIGGCLAYALADWGGWPRLTYDPYADRWWWRSGATAPVPINYYGGLLWAVAGGAAGAALGVAGAADRPAVVGAGRRPRRRRAVAGAEARAVTGTADQGAAARRRVAGRAGDRGVAVDRDLAVVDRVIEPGRLVGARARAPAEHQRHDHRHHRRAAHQ